jgi:S-formylglutathione hydrolase FrmB
MGAFGAFHLMRRNPHSFGTLGTVIGLLDYPNASYVREDNFPVSDVFPQQENKWVQWQAARHVECLRGAKILQVAGNQAFDNKMNRHFREALKVASIPSHWHLIEGGHDWPVVKAGLLWLLDSIPKFQQAEKHFE